jgi:hypothetical protein
MEDDPQFLFFLAAACFVGYWWMSKAWLPSNGILHVNSWRYVLTGSLIASLAVLYLVLTHWASYDVISSTYYVLGYLSMGVIWVFGSVKFLGIFVDIRLQEDVREHNNLAAAVLVGALSLAVTFAFAGGNIGDGPGWWVVVFCAVLSTLLVYGVAWAVSFFTDGEERITVDHDMATAIRLGGALLGAGLIAGRSVAGNWVSVDATIADWARTGWPVAIIAVAAVLIERVSPPWYLRNMIPQSVLMAIAYVGVPLLYVASLGPW